MGSHFAAGSAGKRPEAAASAAAPRGPPGMRECLVRRQAAGEPPPGDMEPGPQAQARAGAKAQAKALAKARAD